MLVYIHGGGYGLGDGTQDMTEIINSNEKKFIAVTIQYRVSFVTPGCSRTEVDGLFDNS